MLFGFCRISISGIIPIPYLAIARGSPYVVPSVYDKIVLLIHRFEDSSYELASACCSAGQRISRFFRASSLLSELKAFSSSISNEVSVSGFSNSSSSCGLHIRFHTSGLSRVEKFFPRFLRPDLIYLGDSIFLLRISPIPIGRTPEFWSEVSGDTICTPLGFYRGNFTCFSIG